jgi:hypothetical protein
MGVRYEFHKPEVFSDGRGRTERHQSPKRLYITQQSPERPRKPRWKRIWASSCLSGPPTFHSPTQAPGWNCLRERCLIWNGRFTARWTTLRGIGAAPFASASLTPAGLPFFPGSCLAFYDKNPLIEVTVSEGNSAELEELSQHGQIDLMIVFTPIGLGNPWRLSACFRTCC